MYKTQHQTTENARQQRKWHLIDASSDNVGRIATEAARYLIGKHKADFSYHLDGGDFVVIVNASKAKVTGKKVDDKKYYHHSDYMGGLSVLSHADMLKTKPDQIFYLAVKGMLPSNKLGSRMLKRLKVYAGETHPYAKHFS